MSQMSRITLCDTLCSGSTSSWFCTPGQGTRNAVPCGMGRSKPASSQKTYDGILPRHLKAAWLNIVSSVLHGTRKAAP